MRFDNNMDKKESHAERVYNSEEENLLAIYVDRAEGDIGSEGKDLYTIKIVNNKELELPPCDKRNEEFPSHKEKKELVKAPKMIEAIELMQGIQMV